LLVWKRLEFDRATVFYFPQNVGFSDGLSQLNILPDPKHKLNNGNASEREHVPGKCLDDIFCSNCDKAFHYSKDKAFVYLSMSTWSISFLEWPVSAEGWYARASRTTFCRDL